MSKISEDYESHTYLSFVYYDKICGKYRSRQHHRVGIKPQVKTTTWVADHIIIFIMYSVVWVNSDNKYFSVP